MQHKTVCARFPFEDLQLLREACKTRGEDASDFIRRAVKKELASLGFYDQETKRVLGMPQKVETEK